MAGSVARFFFFFRNKFTALFNKSYQVYPKFFLTNVLCLENTPIMKTYSFLHHVFSVDTHNSSSGKLVTTPGKRLGLPSKIDFVIAK